MSSPVEVYAPADPNQEPLHPTVFDVGTERLARVYADALLGAAEAAKEDPSEVVGELDSLINVVFRAVPDAGTFLGSLAISRERKADSIQRRLKDRASEMFVDFLLVLNAHGRLDLLRAILAEARGLLDQRKNLVRVLVRSAVPLDADQRERLTHELLGFAKRTPVLEFTVDPELIGGLIVQAEDYQYDASVRTQLESIRNQIIEKGSHEIQSRRDRFSSHTGNL